MKAAIVAALAATAAAMPAPQGSDPSNAQLVISSSSDPTYDGLWMTSYHIGAGEGYAVLVPNNSSLPNGGAAPIVLNGNGDDKTVAFLAGPNGSLQEGLVIPGEGEAMEVVSGPGTDGFYVQKEEGSPPSLRYQGTAISAFYACTNSTLPFGPGVQLFHVRELDTLPADCGVVDFILSPATS